MRPVEDVGTKIELRDADPRIATVIYTTTTDITVASDRSNGVFNKVLVCISSGVARRPTTVASWSAKLIYLYRVHHHRPAHVDSDPFPSGIGSSRPPRANVFVKRPVWGEGLVRKVASGRFASLDHLH
jgi:hypothetical protein